MTEKQIRTTNRLRMPKGMRLDLQMEKLEQRKKDLAEYEKKLHAKITESKKEKKASYNPMLPMKRARGTQSPQRQSPSPNRHKTQAKRASTPRKTPLRISKSNSGKNSQKKSATSVKKRASASPKKGDVDMGSEKSGEEAHYDPATMPHEVFTAAHTGANAPYNAAKTRQRNAAAGKPSGVE